MSRQPRLVGRAKGYGEVVAEVRRPPQLTRPPLTQKYGRRNEHLRVFGKCWPRPSRPSARRRNDKFRPGKRGKIVYLDWTQTLRVYEEKGVEPWTRTVSSPQIRRFNIALYCRSSVVFFSPADVECRHINGTSVLKFMSFELKLDDCLKAL